MVHPPANTMQTNEFTPQELVLYPSDTPYFPKEETIEELLAKIARIFKNHEVKYEYSDLYNEITLCFENTTTRHSFRIYANQGPDARLDIDSRFVIVTKVYGNDRIMEDYRLMRILGNIIQEGDGNGKSEELAYILRYFSRST
ncbi:hypothetical protein EBS02_11795 [bacterium]|nr:hypothetical protein [bacterium]